MGGLTSKAKLFAGNSNQPLASAVAGYLHERLGSAHVHQFQDGEVAVEIDENVRGLHTFILQSTCQPTNDNLMELLVMVDALRRSAAKSITAVIPYYGYSRQDRRPNYTRTPITSRLVADMIQTAGVDQVIVLDIHSGQQQGFFHIPLINISASPLFVADIWKKHAAAHDTVIVSPDTGGVARARTIAKQIDNASLAIIDKRRPRDNVSEVMNVIGDVEGKRCIVIDDMIDTAGTLCKGAAALKEHGAKYVAAYATHPVLSGPALDNIRESVLDEVVVTDTIQHTSSFSPVQLRQISVAGLIAETLRRIRSKESVSEIYTGH